MKQENFLNRAKQKLAKFLLANESTKESISIREVSNISPIEQEISDIHTSNIFDEMEDKANIRNLEKELSASLIQLKALEEAIQEAKGRMPVPARRDSAIPNRITFIEKEFVRERDPIDKITVRLKRDRNS
ncbi:MAG: hypothetical protein AAF587_20300 [Bacteroidota bacterium]